jgi:hemin uptake protein HemP
MNGAQVMAAAANKITYPEAPSHDAGGAEQRIRVSVAELLQGGREAILVHDGQDYRLRITANGKLILTK